MNAETIIDTLKLTASTSGKYTNMILERTNDHLIRLSVMTEHSTFELADMETIRIDF